MTWHREVRAGKFCRHVAGIRSSGRGAPDPKRQPPTPPAWEVYDIDAMLALEAAGMITPLRSGVGIRLSVEPSIDEAP